MEESSPAFGMPPDESQSSESKRRWPAQRRRVSEIKPEDKRVQILGFVKQSTPSSVTLDDGTGNVVVNFDEPELAKNAASWKAVRVYGRPMAGQIKGEIVQDMRKLNIDLYRKVMV